MARTAATTASVRRGEAATERRIEASADTAPKLADREGPRADRRGAAATAPSTAVAATMPSWRTRSAAGSSAAYEPSEIAGHDADEAEQGEHRGAGAIAGRGGDHQRLDGDERERRADRSTDEQRVAELLVTARGPQAEDVEGEDEGEEACEGHARMLRRAAPCHQPWG